MSAIPVPTVNIAALYNNTTSGTDADPQVMDNAIIDIVATINTNASEQNNNTDAAILPHADGSVITNKLADAAVTTVKIAPLAVTTAKIATGAVGSAQLDPTLLTDYGNIAVQAEFDRRGINPMKYGAVGDGVHDDTAAILSAISYLTVSGGEIKLPPGSFRFTSNITVPNGVNLIGSGSRESYAGNTNNRPTVLLKDGNFEGITLNASASLSDLCVDGAVGNGGLGVRINGNRARVENVNVTKMGGNGVAVGDPLVAGNRNSWILRNVASTSNVGHGFVIDTNNPGAGPDANAGLAERANAYANGGDGFVIGACSVNTFIQCYAESNVGVGYRVKSTSIRNAFINCGSEQNTVDQFLLEASSSNNLVFGAFVYTPTDSGTNTVIQNTGGASQHLKISRLVRSGQTSTATSGLDSGMIAVGNVPGFGWNDLDGPTDEKIWDMISNAGMLSIRMCADDGTGPVTALSMERVGKTVSLTKVSSMLTASSLGVGNSAVATTLGTLSKKMQVFDVNGNSLGFVPIYTTIT